MPIRGTYHVNNRATHSISYALALGFGIAGLVQLAGPEFVRRAYLRWNYPPRILRLTGTVELAAAMLLALGPARPLGVALGAGVNFIAVVLLLKNREWLLAVPGIVVTAALPLVLLPVV